jgi:hypothetical protein
MELRYIHFNDALKIINDPVSSSYSVVADSGWLSHGSTSQRTLVLADFDGTWEMKLASCDDNECRLFSHEMGRWVDDLDEETGTWGTLKWIRPGVSKTSTWRRRSRPE